MKAIFQIRIFVVDETLHKNLETGVNQEDEREKEINVNDVLVPVIIVLSLAHIFESDCERSKADAAVESHFVIPILNQVKSFNSELVFF